VADLGENAKLNTNGGACTRLFSVTTLDWTVAEVLSGASCRLVGKVRCMVSLGMKGALCTN
jgi:hypothetical protein